MSCLRKFLRGFSRCATAFGISLQVRNTGLPRIKKIHAGATQPVAVAGYNFTNYRNTKIKKDLVMESPKNKMVLALISAVFSAYVFWLAWGSEQPATTASLIFTTILGVGFAAATLAMLTDAQHEKLNNIAMLCVGLPSLVLLVFYVWFLYDGTWEFTLGRVKGLVTFGFGVYITGTIASLSENDKASDA